MIRWRQIKLVLMTTALVTTPAIAQEVSRPKALSITATIVTATGTQEAEQKDQHAVALYPGDTVHYQLVFTNIVDVPVQNIAFTDRVPTGLVYVPGSSVSDADDVDIEYSIDNGSTYSGTPMVETTIDGERALHPAPPNTYTHIRWRVKDVIQPRAQVTAGFRAQLPNTSQPHTASSSRTGRNE